ncbi:MAG: helicase-exonuclease AddAB subunit AddA [Lachnospiraceae bacterium]|nr:helicase-exonuclease AddAB subunit AddA [Lachnospiraceae bacterium]
MAVKWTIEQEQAISLSGRNLLVSAAAGSGKTAVLVERIIRKITEGPNPLDIDRMLIVTFTNAAAAQMRERIGEAIEKKLDTDPENTHLRRQSTLIHHAKITTIDSFCLSVVRDYFNRLDLSPDFRVGDPGELKLLRADVMDRLMEDKYASGDEAFLQMVEGYASGKADGGIRELIERLYDFSMSYPFPAKQREIWRDELKANDGRLDQQLWMKELLEDIHRLAGEVAELYRDALEETEEDSELAFYAPMFSSDLLGVSRICEAKTFAELHEAFCQLNFMRKPVNRKFAGDPMRKEYLSSLRDRLKKQLTGLRDLVLSDDEESLAEKLERNRSALEVLLDLSSEFEQRFSEAKRDKNVVDFGDVEHCALTILVNEDETPTDAALSYAARFEEVMIDEYQDSNRVQELLLGSVARENNRFMVGDVKQSIYRFRLARPELFVEKYNTYTDTESTSQKVILSRNFRSRKEVLSQINRLFEQLMTPALGQIAYDEAAALYPGAEYPETADDRFGELLLVDCAEEISDDVPEELAIVQARELEARAVAEKIRALTDRENGMTISHKGTLRKAGYGDVVILLRTMSGWSDTFVRVLNDNGIPAVADLQSGYFDAPEVKLLLDYLRIIDNPNQDIPLAAVLHSPMVGLTSEELALIMAEYQTTPELTERPNFHRGYRYYLENGQNEELRGKLIQLEEQLTRFRFLSIHLSVQELLRKILSETGYDRIAAAMPGGKVRRGNLEQLAQKAADYAKTSYSGLFNFIRYIEHLQKYEVDFGEAAGGEHADAVRVMSIHRSKGLEFPIVFVSGLAKPFNHQDSNARVLLHPDLGITADCIDLETRVRTKTLQQKVFARRMRLDSMGEELRVLYVALTRAKEKLILTACDKNPEKRWEKFAAIAEEERKALPYLWISSAGSYLDWVMMGLTRPQELWKTETVSLNRLLMTEVHAQIGMADQRDEFEQWDTKRVYLSEVRAELAHRMEYEYPYTDQMDMHVKLSVSELKAFRSDAGEVDYLYRLDPEREDGAERYAVCGETGHKMQDQIAESGKNQAASFEMGSVQNSDSPKDRLRGAQRGTFLHRILERLDFTDIGSAIAVDEQIKDMCWNGILDEDDLSRVSLAPISRFLGQNLAKRMTKAAQNGKLHRESRFVMGVPADEIGGAYHGDEMILVQGMIDCWFEEDDGLVIVDYKSDRVDPKNGERQLIERYKVQLEYYRRALAQSTGKRVKECRIYSFALGRDFSVYVRESQL